MTIMTSSQFSSNSYTHDEVSTEDHGSNDRGFSVIPLDCRVSTLKITSGMECEDNCDDDDDGDDDDVLRRIQN
jgi:hypothetical protein